MSCSISKREKYCTSYDFLIKGSHTLMECLYSVQCSGDEVFRALQDQGMGGGGGGRGRGSYRGEHGYRSGGDRGGGRRGYMDEERRRRPSDGSSNLKVRGLPYSATEEDIIKFFAEYEVSVGFKVQQDHTPSQL